MKTAILLFLIMVLAATNAAVYIGAQRALEDRQAQITDLRGKLAAADAQLATFRAEREQLRYQAATASAALKLCQEMNAGLQAWRAPAPAPGPEPFVTLESIMPEPQKPQQEAASAILRVLVKLLF